MKKKRRGFAHPVFTAAIVASFCALFVLSPVTIAAATLSGVYDIPAILPLTGFGAFIGKSEEETLAVVERHINASGGIRGKAVHFTIADSQSSPQLDVQLTNAAILQHPAVIIDGGPATACKAVAPLYVNGPVMFCISSAFFSTAPNFTFGAGVDSHVGMETTLNFIRNRKWNRIGIITATDVAGQEADTALRQLLALPVNKQLDVVAWEHLSGADLSVAAQMSKIKAANPDVIIGWATGPPVATILRGVRDANIALPFIASAANQLWGQMQQYSGILPANFYLYSLQWPAYSSMRGGPLKGALDAYVHSMTVGGVHPDGVTAMTWDSAMLIAEALRKLGTDAAPGPLRAHLANLHDYYGASGSFDFRLGNQRGLGIQDCIMVRWNAKKNEWIPASAAGGSARR